MNDMTPVSLNVEMEQQLLGALLGDNRLSEKIGDLEPRHFGDPVHGRIFEWIMDRIRDGRLASPVTLKPLAEAEDGLRALGGAGYLARLVGVGNAYSIGEFAAEVRALWSRREAARILAGAQDELGRPDGGRTDEVLARLDADLATVQRVAAARQASSSFLKVTTDALQHIADVYSGQTGLAGISTGLRDLDDLTGGLERGKFYILGGRPGMGKSAVALHVAASCAQRGEPVLFVSLEMPPKDMAMRFFSSALLRRGIRVPYSDMGKGRLDETEFRALVEVMREHEALPLDVADVSLKDTVRLRAAVRRATKHFESMGGLKLLVVDYLQLLRPPKADRMIDRVSEASQLLKEMALEFDIPVLALSQLSRGVEARGNRRPMLSDLRESGQIEQDADTVMFTYREAYYLAREIESETDANRRIDASNRLERVRHQMEVLVAKQRSGRLGHVVLRAEMMFNALSDEVRNEEMEL